MPDGRPPALRFAGVSHDFGSGPVLVDASFSLLAGSRWALAGPNGSGKSTLLRLAAGILLPEAGSIEAVGGSPRRPEVRERIGHLGPGDGFYPALSGAENLSWFAGLRSGCKDPEEALEEVGLQGAASKPVAAYSTGMRRRLALARLALAPCDLYLLDEPFRGLDTAGAAWLDSWLEGLAAGASLLLVTHDSRRAARHATGVARLEHGRLQVPA
ncbi:ABC transporter ATP-binding protein [bacterium]|nr:ABC transporter ATP-binding protein [bacterium]